MPHILLNIIVGIVGMYLLFWDDVMTALTNETPIA